MREGHLAGATRFSSSGPRRRREFRANLRTDWDPQLAARRAGVERRLLGIKPDLRELIVKYGGHSGRDDEIDPTTRSMLQIMLEFAAIGQVPEADVVEGKARPGAVDLRRRAAERPTFTGLGHRYAAQDAYAAVQYDGRWFWIADTDIQSKYTFAIIMLLFSIADTGVKGLAPVVTIPANQ